MANLFRCAGAGGEDIKCIERPYNSNDIYNTGDTAMYNGLLRICTADGVTGEFDVSKWEVTTLDELLGENIGENDALVDYIASEYDPTHTYAAGDAILGDNGEILKCLEDDVTGEFDNSKWSRDYLCNLSGNVNSNLGNISIINMRSDSINGTPYSLTVDNPKTYKKLAYKIIMNNTHPQNFQHLTVSVINGTKVVTHEPSGAEPYAEGYIIDTSSEGVTLTYEYGRTNANVQSAGVICGII